MESRTIQLAVLLVFVVCVYGSGPQYDLNHAPDLFMKFVKDYKRVYKSDYDLIRHYDAFKNSLITINKLNADGSSATFDINNFADYTKEEQQTLFGFGFTSTTTMSVGCNCCCKVTPSMHDETSDCLAHFGQSARYHCCLDVFHYHDRAITWNPLMLMRQKEKKM